MPKFEVLNGDAALTPASGEVQPGGGIRLAVAHALTTDLMRHQHLHSFFLGLGRLGFTYVRPEPPRQ